VAAFMLTVDVEPDWGMAGTRAVREALPRLLSLLEEARAAATFFVVGDMVRECGEALARIRSPHEIASHGLTHRPLDGLSLQEVREELAGSRDLLGSLGQRPRGVRAPFFRTPRAWLDLVAAAGYEYDSSSGAVYPSPRNTSPDRWLPERRGNIAVIPLTTLADRCTPCCLTYLRLYAPFGRRMISAKAAILYLHLHEFLPADAARVLPLGWRLALTRNCGDKAWRILERLLAARQGDFVTCSEYLARYLPADRSRA